MNYMTKIADYEAAVERRLEKSCERNGWIASAHVSFDADYVDCQLEKFGREEVRDDADTLNSLEAFLSQEFGFRLADKPTALRRDSKNATIEEYFGRLTPRAVFAKNRYGESKVIQALMSQDKSSIGVAVTFPSVLKNFAAYKIFSFNG